jgi:ABC-type transport system involved in multi-copper enzyme maturation permease subunit
MTRFAWLQVRLQTAVAFGVLAIVGVILLATGPHLVQLYDMTVATCTGDHDCPTVTTAFLDTDGPLKVFADFLLLLSPALIGMFWGAPLVAREFETGSFRLAWTQGVTRTRWLATKISVGVVASMLLVGLLSLMTTWWSSLIDQVGMDPFDPLRFGVRDVTPVGYAAFAFVLGVTGGLLTRRTLPAMAITFAGFVGARVAIGSWVRPHLMAPLHTSMAIAASTPLNFAGTPTGVTVAATTRGILPGDWAYSAKIVDQAGHAPTTAFLGHACPFNQTTGQLNLPTCTANLAAKFHSVVTYQPTSRYWAFQWDETAIFAGLTVALAGICLWWVRRPTS